ncbi:helix-turn-helix domain-containing protein [Legionella spiritensis]|uniref:Transcriptional regulator n=1 Tax=Legionella spiritensis TaxID=452 RepID=A0A0W0YXQ9_LEGSP|nr:helix-turn-helix transcriptional regulator [Legionella spiritensis]KTD61655.1 transcriptional regulator [Legionella spiritensis]SNV39116.1 transcriptional regulator [Legionella spiritensis]
MNKNIINSVEELAEVLKIKRHQLKITQKSLAAFCNLSHNGISRIELGQTDVQLSTILKMSKVLGFKVILEMEP